MSKALKKNYSGIMKQKLCEATLTSFFTFSLGLRKDIASTSLIYLWITQRQKSTQ